MVTKTKTPSLHQLTTIFTRRPHLSPATSKYYSILLKNLAWYAQNNEWPPPEDITQQHLRQFVDYVATESFRWPGQQRSSYKAASSATVHHYGTVVKALFRWAEEEGYLDHNPAYRLKLARAHYKEVEPYSDDEVLAMLRMCDQDATFRYHYIGIRNKAILSLFVATGLRLSEMAGIKLSELDPKLRQLRVMGKGAKMRVVPIDGEARKALRSYLGIRPKGGDYLWTAINGEPFQRYSIRIMVVRLKRRSGIDSSGGPHRFRHYFATRYLEAGGNINSLRLLLGHATLSMVLKYSRFVDVQKAIAEHEAISPLDRLYNGGNHNRSDDDWGWKG